MSTETLYIATDVPEGTTCDLCMTGVDGLDMIQRIAVRAAVRCCAETLVTEASQTQHLAAHPDHDHQPEPTDYHIVSWAHVRCEEQRAFEEAEAWLDVEREGAGW